jgi:hypothetical protein
MSEDYVMRSMKEYRMLVAKEVLESASAMYGFDYEESVLRILGVSMRRDELERALEPVLERALEPEVREEVREEVHEEVRKEVRVSEDDKEVSYKKVTPKKKREIKVKSVLAAELAPECERVLAPAVEVEAGVVVEVEVEVEAGVVVEVEAGVEAVVEKECDVVVEKECEVVVVEKEVVARKRKPSPKDLREKAEREAKAAVLKAEREAREEALQLAKRERALALQAAKEAKQAALQAEKDAKQAALQAAKEAKMAKEVKTVKDVGAKPTAKKVKSKEVVVSKPAVAGVAVAVAGSAVEGGMRCVPAAVKEVEGGMRCVPAVEGGMRGVPAAVAEEYEEDEDEDEEAVIDVKLFKWNGVSYLRSVDGVIYDVATNEALGVWSENGNKIEFDSPESEEELCATEMMEDSECEGGDDGVDGLCKGMVACAV